MIRLLPSLARPRYISSSSIALAGHNKWSKIKQKKGVNDAARSATLTKARRDILIAVRTGGGVDPETNLALAVVLRRLRDAAIPKDNIERTLSSAAKSDEKTGETVTYEAMAFGSVGVIIECITNNPTRTVQEMRAILTKNNARIAPVSFMFQRSGIVKISLPIDSASAAQDDIVDKALDGGALDFEDSTGEAGNTELTFYCEPSALSQLTQSLTTSGHGCELLTSELAYRPLEKSVLPDDIAESMEQLMSTLDEYEDVSQVWTTVDD